MAVYGRTLVKGSGKSEVYNRAGRLIAVEDHGKLTTLAYRADHRLKRVTGPFGRTLDFTYSNVTGNLIQVTDPAANTLRYAYTANDNLQKVTYQDNSSRTYLYEDPNFENYLTGIVDENGQRYASFEYNAGGRVVLSEHAGGYDRASLSYNNDITTVTGADGSATEMAFTEDAGRHKPTRKTLNGKTVSNSYDDRKRLTSKTDELGRTTKYTYSEISHMASMTEAVGLPEERTTTYEYLNKYSALPTLITRPSVFATGTSQTEIAYDAGENPDRITQRGFTPTGSPVERTVTMQYNALAQITQIDGPRTDVNDVTTLTYYPNVATEGNNQGQLKSASNALSHTVN